MGPLSKGRMPWAQAPRSDRFPASGQQHERPCCAILGLGPPRGRLPPTVPVLLFWHLGSSPRARSGCRQTAVGYRPKTNNSTPFGFALLSGTVSYWGRCSPWLRCSRSPSFGSRAWHPMRCPWDGVQVPALGRGARDLCRPPPPPPRRLSAPRGLHPRAQPCTCASCPSSSLPLNTVIGAISRACTPALTLTLTAIYEGRFGSAKCPHRRI